ncbi:hypothetical protein TthSNM76_23060 (plasmid) [Thermus thermophilus]|nr:hypothetical protein TthSNM76_23060 [Thermus thermophilus]
MEAPLAVKKGEGQGLETAPLLQSDQVQDHQETGLGAFFFLARSRAFSASFLARRMRARVGQG